MMAFERFEREYVKPKQGRVLITGSKLYEGREDRRKRYRNAEGWDMLAGDGVDRVIDLGEPLAADASPFDHVECLSVLEHCAKPQAVAANIQALMVQGGTLFVAAPFVWRPHAYPNDYWRFTREGIVWLFPRIRWHALYYGRNQEITRDLDATKLNGEVWHPRTEVWGFGEKRLDDEPSE